MSGRPLPCDAAELGTLFLFEKLSPEQLDRLCREGRVEEFEPGYVYREGEPATCFFVLLEGTLVMSRRVGGDDVEINRSSQRGAYSGAMQAYLTGGEQARYKGSVRVTEPSRFFVLPAEPFAAVLRDWFPMAVHLLEGLFFGSKNTQAAIGQRERLLALGSLSAGLTHELNNPAAAAVRATATLRERVAKMRHKLAIIAESPFSREQLAGLIEIRGLGIRRIEHVGQAEVGLVVDLAAEDADRLPAAEALTTLVEGVELPRIPVNLLFSPLPLIVAALTTTVGTGAARPSADCPKGIANHISPTIATE